MKQLLIEIDEDMATQLERVAPARSRRRSEFIRAAIRRALWELPAGSLKQGEDTEAAARRECQEEVGMIAARLDENLEITPAPGHTPGTIAIKFDSRGDKALFCGDILHHALQVYHPEWNSFACADAEGARRSRRAALEHCAGSGARLMPCHFGAPFTCHIDHKADGFVPRFDGAF